MTKASKHWNLYWVESDGFEDCFVVARNSRSARFVECNMNGFELEYTHATKIARIPKKVENSCKRHADYKKGPWPGYVYGKKLFEGLGAQFRKVEEQEEMLLNDVVYLVDEYMPKKLFSKKQEEEISLFAAYFSPKPDSI